MVFVNVGDGSNNRREIQKRRIGFIGFGHQKFARSQAGIRASAIEFSADDKSRIQPACGEQ